MKPGQELRSMLKPFFRFALGVVVSLYLASSVDSHAAAVKPRVALLTSVDAPAIASHLPWYLGFAKSTFYEYLSVLEKDFRARMKDEPVDVDVFHYADQATLHSVLTSPEYVAVYWVSHGAGPSTSVLGSSPGSLFDQSGFELTPIFSDIHPNIEILGLVGCRGGGIADELIAQFTRERTHRNIKIFAFDTTVDAKAGLISTLKESRGDLPQAIHHFEQYDPAKCETLQGYYVNLKRRCENETAGEALYPSVRVQAQGVVIAIFPACEREGEIQTTHAWIPGPLDTFSKGKLKLVVDSGRQALPTSKTLALGKFAVHTAGRGGHGSWKTFSRPDGIAFGTNSHVLSFEGTEEDLGFVQSFNPYRCSLTSK